MPPTTSRDFQKAAGQRLTTAQTLLREKLTLDAQYIGGYTVECSLKALIMELTSDPDKPGKLMRITSGASMHKPDVLLGELRILEPLFRSKSPRGCGASSGIQTCGTRQGGGIQEKLPLS